MSLQSLLDNYEVLFGVWNDVLLSSNLDSEMKARIIGVNTQMHTFDFLFGISLENILLLTILVRAFKASPSRLMKVRG